MTVYIFTYTTKEWIGRRTWKRNIGSISKDIARENFERNYAAAILISITVQKTPSQLFGINLKATRAKQNRTQQEMSNFLGVARATYQSWEIGKNQPKIAILIAICKKLKITVQDFLTIELQQGS